MRLSGSRLLGKDITHLQITSFADFRVGYTMACWPTSPRDGVRDRRHHAGRRGIFVRPIESAHAIKSFAIDIR